LALKRWEGIVIRSFLAPLAGLALCSVNALEGAPIDVAVRAEMEAQARHIDSLRMALPRFGTGHRNGAPEFVPDPIFGKTW
jgi:hypothetical protein